MCAISRVGVAAIISCDDAEYRTVDGSSGFRTNLSYMLESIGIIDGRAVELGGAKMRGPALSAMLPLYDKG